MQWSRRSRPDTRRREVRRDPGSELPPLPGRWHPARAADDPDHELDWACADSSAWQALRASPGQGPEVFMSEGNQFTLLIGSCARGTSTFESDIDVVRIGHRRAADVSVIPEVADVLGPLSYVDYDQATFFRLYNKGSLFIKHILSEGRLLGGSKSAWSLLQRSFRVQEDFTQEIESQFELYRWLRDPSQFEGAEYALLSYTFRALKNLGVFSMAQEGRYIFEKREVLEAFLPQLPEEDIDLLIRVNRIFERHLEPSEISPELLAFAPLMEFFDRIDRTLNERITM